MVAIRLDLVSRVDPGSPPPDRDGAARLGSTEPIPPARRQYEWLRRGLGPVRRATDGRTRELLGPRRRTRLPRESGATRRTHRRRRRPAFGAPPALGPP